MNLDHLAPDRADFGIVALSSILGGAVAANVADAPMGQLQVLVMGALMTAVSTVVGVGAKAALAGVVAWLRSDAKSKREDNDKTNDNFAAAEDAAANVIERKEVKQ